MAKGIKTAIRSKTILGTAKNDILKGDHQDGDTIDGLGGNDTITALNGNDFLTGGTGDDKVYAAGGDDLIFEGLGNDFIDGGTGIDSVTYGTMTVGVTVDLAITTSQNTGAGLDTIINVENVNGGMGANTLYGNALDNRLTGGNSNDYLNGRDGNDWLHGAGGNDLLFGGAGDDNLIADAGTLIGNDYLDGGSGVDTADYTDAGFGVTIDLSLTGAQNTGVGLDTIINIENINGSRLDDVLTGDSGANRIFASVGQDVLNGMGGNDVLDGFTGSDIVNGGDGNDIVSGGMIGVLGEHDILTGGAGADMFVFANVGYSWVGSEDRITDFSSAEGDIIDLHNNTFFLPQTFVGGAEFSGGFGEIRTYDAGNGTWIVQVDYDGNRAAEMSFEVVTGGPLTSADFIF